MINIDEKLSHLEKNLEALIEGSAARVFPSIKSTNLYAEKLLIAIKDNIQVSEDGREIAPNLYSFHINLEEQGTLSSNDPIFSEISLLIKDLAAGFGYEFLKEPVVRINSDPVKPRHELTIEVQHSDQDISQTLRFKSQNKENNEAIPEDAFLIVNGTKIFPLNQSVINIGRRNDNNLIIRNKRISRLHAQIRAIRGQFVIFDLESKGGTFVNNKRINECSLFPGDVISLAGVPIVYGQDPAVHTETQDYFP